MAERLHRRILDNGMVLLGEPMEGVESVAFNLMLPAGASALPEGCCGAPSVIADWIFRGAGSRSSRQLSDALDGLGLHRASSVGSAHISIGAALESANLAPALGLYADIILRPNLRDDEFELARQLALDAVRALDDEPRQKVVIKLKEQFYPYPLGRSTVGDVDQLRSLAPGMARQIVKEYFRPSQMIFSVAGKYDFDDVCIQLEKLFDDERTPEPPQIKLGPRGNRYLHIEDRSAQVHIGLMTSSARPGDENYYNARLAVSVLSGGMSARLFTEVREKRGLCYAVGARYHGLKQAAGVICYAGTTPDKAQETIDVITDQFERLADGITPEEMDRAKVGLKSSLILQSESSSSRASAIGTDYYLLGRVRSLDEIKEKIDATTVDSVLGYLRDNRFREFTVVTIGPRPVSVE